MLGPYANGAAIIVGGLLGSVMGKRLPERLRSALPMTFGLCSMGLGIMLIIKVKYMPAVVLAMIIGAMLGELFYVEKGIGKIAGSTRRVIDSIFPAVDDLSHTEFTDKFVAVLVLFCASGTGVFGAMHEGMTGDPSILYIKTILDLFTAAIFATLLGYAIITIAIPQLVIQLGLAYLAALILPLTTPEMMADFSATGGLIMLATGFRIAGVKLFPIANMLPGLLLIMPFSSLWATYIA